MVKIALVAPFEGRLRQVGYDAFPALRLAVRQAIEQNNTNVSISFVAYNDNGDPAMAERVARNVAIDPNVVAVIGHWVPTTTLAALHVYTEAGLPILVPGFPADALPQDALIFRMGPTRENKKLEVRSEKCGSSALFTSYFFLCTSDAPPVADIPGAAKALQGFTDITLGTPPAPRSMVAFDATNVVIAAIRLDAADGTVTRAGVAEAIRRAIHRGLLGEIKFDQTGIWESAPLWVFAE